MRDKTGRAGVERALAIAIDKGLRRSVEVMTPRAYVDLRVMPPFELGLLFKRALRDELYDRRRANRRKTATRKSEKGR